MAILNRKPLIEIIELSGIKFYCQEIEDGFIKVDAIDNI